MTSKFPTSSNHAPISFSMVASLVLLLAMFSQASSAQKLYKIVDENGKVSFSQYPPRDVDISKIEDVVIEEQNAANKVAVRTVGGRQYCGKISLNIKSRYQAKARDLSNFERTLAQWKTGLANTQARLDTLASQQLQASATRSRYESDQRRNQRYKDYVARREQYVKSIAEYQCAIDWAQRDEEVTVTQQDIAAINQKTARLEEVYRSIQGQQQRTCGEEPEFNPSVQHIKYQHDQWVKCRSPFQKDLAAVKSKLREVGSH